MEFKRFSDDYYEAVCDFLIELNRGDKKHINWNWARFEWMYEHPEFDKDSRNSIGLWLDGGRVVGAAIYDMYFGEAFCAALKDCEELYPEILSYARDELGDEHGLGISICDDNSSEIEAAKKAGFELAEQRETVMSKRLDGFMPEHSGVYGFEELDSAESPYEFQWLLWQGFDHGTDRNEFERAEAVVPQIRRHFNPALSLAALNEAGEKVAYCCLWYSGKTDYAYVEPVCTVPSYRGMGAAGAIVSEAMKRAAALGAVTAYVISDLPFYSKLGFETCKTFSFYWKK